MLIISHVSEVIADLPQPDKFEESIVYGLTAVLQPRFQSDTDAAVFRDIIRDVFPLCSDIGAVKHDPDLVAFIKDQLRTDGECYVLIVTYAMNYTHVSVSLYNREVMKLTISQPGNTSHVLSCH